MERSDEVTSAFRAYLDAMASGDTAALDEMLAEDVLIIGTDPTEWWSGHEQALAVFRAQLAEMGGAFPLTPTDPRGYADGSVGWACDRPSLSLPDGEQSLRLTAVFRQREGRWRVVQSHASFGVGNQDALGRELTT